jgi:UDP-N-acetylmuramoylalanine--D-glutamate ligase
MNKYKNLKVAVLGLGIEGSDAVKYLLSMGARVSLFDQKPESEIDFGGIKKNSLNLYLGPKYNLKLLKDFDAVVRSPGVYRYLPEIVDAEKSGTEITSPIKIFFEECPGKIIGVTGTKGKGTTSTLIYETLKSDSRDVYLAGNIGKPYLELLPRLDKESIVILEMSSFQLIDMNVSPNIAVVLNITADHMDWHKDIEEYVNAKKNIVLFQKPSDFAVINEEYDVPRNFAESIKSKIIFFSKNKLDSKFKTKLLLRGEHNLENIAAAVAVAKILKVDEKKIGKVIRNFKGLEHRLELVGSVKGIAFYNDSFATGPQPTIAAIKSFTEPETLILGGSDKGLDYSELGDVVNHRANIKNIILIGTTASKIGGFLKKNLGFRILNLGFSSMDKIVKKAFEATEKGGVVVLSPASASFDMFENYKDRGNQFKEAVRKLK